MKNNKRDARDPVSGNFPETVETGNCGNWKASNFNGLRQFPVSAAETAETGASVNEINILYSVVQFPSQASLRRERASLRSLSLKEGGAARVMQSTPVDTLEDLDDRYPESRAFHRLLETTRPGDSADDRRAAL